MCGHILYPSVSSTKPYGKRTLDQTQQQPPMRSQRHRRQQTAGGGGKMTAVSTPPEHVLLGRVYFMNNEKSKYVSVGGSSRSLLQPCVEFGAPRRTPVVLTSYYLSTLSQHLPKLCENMCNNQTYACKKLLFRLQASATVTYDKQSISLRLNELNYLLVTFVTLENQLARYTFT